MNFVSIQFFAFFSTVFFIYWHLPRKQQNLFLLATSWLFYACWDWQFLSLIIISTASNYVCGLQIFKADTAGNNTQKRIWLILAIVINLGILFYFKYAGFFVTSFTALGTQFGWFISETTLNITLPVGISFYIFQSLSYSLDIYRRQLTPNHSLLDFATFVGFFPQLVAGPIVRAKEFLYQLETDRKFSGAEFERGFTRFLTGFFKKAFIADNLAIYLVDPVFNNPGAYSTETLWLAMVGYAIQIYADFSGYSNMAIGCAMMLGFKLPENFRFPYLAVDFSDFWRRWHITMSRFFRDYVYIALGGNRQSKIRTLINLFTTTLISGLWHGAGWTFVGWGGLHGLFIAINHFLRDTFESINNNIKQLILSLTLIPRWLITQLMVCIAWVLFRSSDFNSAQIYLDGLWASSGQNTITLSTALYTCLIAFILDHLYGWFKEHHPNNKTITHLSPYIKPFVLAGMIIILFYGKPQGAAAFIYFQF